ncbi:MAG: cytochrome c oxidase assembly protein [Bradyrhizobium sp.]|uniref:cytochrome c oxidase assembly protein n=1 Tax=Bradyrhizobium sp. TaxID=376 RepID=UPI001E030040|nr:cytochrome c oxidase assembly protein [Bradyrhizobium sp.]MBV9561442.1 cytochrome c oxidase assembly protein [Bradyrhizobium sp.]
MRTIGLLLIALLCVAPAFAHGPGGPSERAAWTFDPWVVVPLAVFGALYAAGAAALHQRSRSQSPVRFRRDIACLLGWASLAGALVSPLHWLGEQLFTFHMIEHEIVMAVSAPLIVFARPLGTLLWSLPRRRRVAIGRLLRSHPIRTAWDWLSRGRNATILHGIVIWAWHAPLLFDAAVTHVMLHRLQHLGFFATAVLFWWSVLRPNEAAAGAWHLFVTMLHTSALGAWMALAPRVLYQVQTAAAPAWGMTPLDDQQLAGVIMWVPAGTIYAGAALALLAIWISRSGGRTREGHAARLF